MWRGSREWSVNLGGRVIKEGECGEVVTGKPGREGNEGGRMWRGSREGSVNLGGRVIKEG